MTGNGTSLLTESETAAPARSYKSSERSWWLRLLLTRDAAVIALLVVVWIYASSQVLYFSDDITLYFLFMDLAPILLIALPMTLIIITGEIDLSVASIVALASVLFGVLHREGVPMVLAVVLAVLACAVAGSVNGLLVTKVGLPSLAVTIGTLALYRGIAVGALGTTAITDWPSSWTEWAKEKIGTSQIPVVVVPIAVLVVAFVVLLHFSSFGRKIFAIGLNQDAARFSGVNVDRTKLLLFTLSGAIAGLAGIYYTLRFGSARGDNATGMELQVIAAVLLGGVSIFGGRGAIPGAIAGVLLIGIIGSALRLDNQSANVIQIITGLLLIASVVAASVFGWTGRVAGTWWRNHGGSSEAQSRPPSAPDDESPTDVSNGPTPNVVPTGSSK